MKTIAYSLASVLILGLLYVLVQNQINPTLGSNANRGTIRCNVSNVAAAVIGDDLSATVLAANSNRAWARVSLVTDSVGVATSTAYLSFDEGAAATINNGVTLATSTPSVDFGLNTDFPYVGEVTGIIKGTASTTVQITECTY